MSKDLRKALCQKMKEATKERLEAKRPLQANYWLGYAEGLEKALDLFSIFLKDNEAKDEELEKLKKEWAKDRDAMFDYLTEAEELKRNIKELKAENVLVPRKQLSELCFETVADIRRYYEDIVERFNDDDMSVKQRDELLLTKFLRLDYFPKELKGLFEAT